MTSRQYVLIVAVIIIVVLGVFFIITSRQNGQVIVNPRAETLSRPNNQPIEPTTASSTATTSASTPNLSATTTLDLQ